MRFERRHGVLLLAVATWNVLTFGMFARNLYSAYAAGEERATGYWVAHSVLIVVNVAIAAILGRLGVRVLRTRT
ncbi:MAG: SCO4848 family membrane protein [Nocardioides sp.]